MRFDPAWFLTGITANTAAAEDGAVAPGPAGSERQLRPRRGPPPPDIHRPRHDARHRPHEPRSDHVDERSRSPSWPTSCNGHSDLKLLRADRDRILDHRQRRYRPLARSAVPGIGAGGRVTGRAARIRPRATAACRAVTSRAAGRWPPTGAGTHPGRRARAAGARRTTRIPPRQEASAAPNSPGNCMQELPQV